MFEVRVSTSVLTSLVTLATVLFLTACGEAKTASPVAATPAPSPAAAAPAKGQSAEAAAPAAPVANQTPDGPLDGNWNMGYAVKGKALHCTLRLQQNGESFSGSGNDEDGKAFIVEQGEFNNGAVTFYKKYEGQGKPIEYTGKYEIAHDNNFNGPYMSGKYSITVNGHTFGDDWEAGKEEQPAAEASTQAQAKGTKTANGGNSGTPGAASPGIGVVKPLSADPNKPPDISGKWSVAYEYNFRTMYSTMYLEQDGSKISGHGMDRNTGEKFIIEKGWYSYPTVALIKRYGGDGKKNPGKTMAFRAKLSIVNNNDYQGPYLQGKTQGGGSWEAELVK